MTSATVGTHDQDRTGVGPEPNVVYPRLLKLPDDVRPEDVGGPWGYGELIEALSTIRNTSVT